ncbi:lipopolysaccharide biosynthesis protein [Aquimarina sp. 2201CG5-10]|uniref:lipopolysaccharide biosynthesis protein n=1 Tax=Aquimarina callyspongiae TaxID=3098150 RepID=UPI002AB3F787|nr:lipopolysaccharide biosynthesis protein [Aquimarina sp. 2201CG5-10]MDY8136896.1 lipopolysaccharide biosynthesis protein [Aquimarina sp. 2201CG5-10]
MTILKEKTTTGLVWSSLDKLLTLFIQFTLGIILARILLPEDYGLIGMIAIFIAISQSVVDSGFFTALVQKKDVNQTDYSTIFFFNIVVGCFLYLILFISAGFIADFYETQILADLIKVIGLNVIIVSTTIVHKAYITTKIDFKTLAIINIVSALMGGAVGIYLAMTDYGVWALVYQSLVRSLVMAVLYWLLNNWKPDIIFNKQSFNALFGFGSKLMLSELLKIFFKNIYLIIIGKIYKAEELGYFTRATLFKQIPSTLVNTILQSVTFPVLVKVIDEDLKVKNLLERSVKLTGFVLFPVICILIFYSKTIILILLTSKWLPTVILLQILSLEIIFHPLQYINLNFLNAKGRSDLFLKLEFIKNALIIVAIISTYKFGLIWMSIGYVIVSFLGFFINTHYTKKYIKYSAVDQLKDLFPYLVVSLIATYCASFISDFFSNEFAQLLLGISLAMVLYLLLSRLLKFRELIELQNLITNKISTKK